MVGEPVGKASPGHQTPLPPASFVEIVPDPRIGDPIAPATLLLRTRFCIVKIEKSPGIEIEDRLKLL